MKPAVIVLLLVARGDMQQPTTAALTRAAETVLGPGSHILLHEQPKALSDDDAIALADQMRASMVVAVTWSSDRMSAHVHVHFSERPGWLERDVAFSASDPPNERGRTLGFEIATMVPDLPPPAQPAPRTAVPPRPEERPVVAEIPLSPRRWAVDLGGVAAFGGDATGYGIGADARWLFAGAQSERAGAGTWFARAGGALRFGRVLEADATSLTLVPAVGAGFTVAAGDRIRVGIRTDALAILTELSRSSPAETRGRWVPGVDVAGEIEVAVAPIAFAAAVGGEYAFGDTVIRVGPADAATLPRTRFVSELGLRWRF